MDWQYLLAAVLAAVIASALVSLLHGRSLRRAVDARFASLETSHRAATAVEPLAGRLAAIAPQLVDLARNATDSAIRRDEIVEWHRPNLEGAADDVSAAARDKLRRAATSAVTTRSMLADAIRRHHDALPAPLEAELRAFVERLGGADDRPAAERRRRFAADLDRLEDEVRRALTEQAG